MTQQATEKHCRLHPKLLIGAALSMLLSGCSLFSSETEYDYRNASYQPEYDQRYIAEFSRELSNEYLRRAKEENYENNYREEKKMHAKSKGAGLGHPIEPEQVYSHDLEERHVPELVHARRRLMWALGNGAPRVYARQAAVAQVAFDCWIEEQDENYKYQQHEVNACKNRFLQNLTEIEAGLNNQRDRCGQAEPTCASDSRCPSAHQVSNHCHSPQPASCGTRALPPTTIYSAQEKSCGLTQKVHSKPSNYIIYFDTDSAEIREDAISTIREVASSYNQGSQAKVSIQGHTDRAGESTYNIDLSQRRVLATITALHLTGIPRESIQEAHFGEYRPKTITRDGEAHQKNRRVEIQLSR